MKSFKQHLLEKRKNPELNPKISAYDALEPYKNDPKIYITLTSVDKVGINPHSNFNTPNAIYTYPLKEIWNGFDHDKRWVYVPFALKSPFIWILKEQCQDFQEIGKYTSKNYDNDMRKIRNLYKSGKILKKYSKNTDEIYNRLIKKFNDLTQKANSLGKGKLITIEQMPSKNMDSSNFYDYIYMDGDVLEDILSEQNKTKFAYLKLFDHQSNVGYADASNQIKSIYTEILEALYTNTLSPINVLIDSATKKADKKTPFSSFWNVTRWIAYEGNPDGVGIASDMDMAKYKQIILPTFKKRTPINGEKLSKADQFWHTDWTVSVNLTSQKWNNLLRELGYCGFADKNGDGAIHPAEPTQAIFLSKNGFKVIEKINNINPKVTYRKMDAFAKDYLLLIRKLKYNDNTKSLVLPFNKQSSYAVNIPVKNIKWDLKYFQGLIRHFNDLDEQFLTDIVLENIYRFDANEDDLLYKLFHTMRKFTDEQILKKLEKLLNKNKIKNKEKSLALLKRYINNKKEI